MPKRKHSKKPKSRPYNPAPSSGEEPDAPDYMGFVEKVIGKRLVNGRVEMLVKWMNHPPTWVPMVNFGNCLSLLEDFETEWLQLFGINQEMLPMDVESTNQDSKSVREFLLCNKGIQVKPFYMHTYVLQRLCPMTITAKPSENGINPWKTTENQNDDEADTLDSSLDSSVSEYAGNTSDSNCDSPKGSDSTDSEWENQDFGDPDFGDPDKGDPDFGEANKDDAPSCSGNDSVSIPAETKGIRVVPIETLMGKDENAANTSNFSGNSPKVTDLTVSPWKIQLKPGEATKNVNSNIDDAPSCSTRSPKGSPDFNGQMRFVPLKELIGKDENAGNTSASNCCLPKDLDLTEPTKNLAEVEINPWKFTENQNDDDVEYMSDSSGSSPKDSNSTDSEWENQDFGDPDFGNPDFGDPDFGEANKDDAPSCSGNDSVSIPAETKGIPAETKGIRVVPIETLMGKDENAANTSNPNGNSTKGSDSTDSPWKIESKPGEANNDDAPSCSSRSRKGSPESNGQMRFVPLKELMGKDENAANTSHSNGNWPKGSDSTNSAWKIQSKPGEATKNVNSNIDDAPSCSGSSCKGLDSPRSKSNGQKRKAKFSWKIKSKSSGKLEINPELVSKNPKVEEDDDDDDDDEDDDDEDDPSNSRKSSSYWKMGPYQSGLGMPRGLEIDKVVNGVRMGETLFLFVTWKGHPGTSLVPLSVMQATYPQKVLEYFGR